MNYQEKKDKVIFELTLSGYLGRKDSYITSKIFTDDDFKNSDHPSGVYVDGYGWRTQQEAKEQGLLNKVIRKRNGYELIDNLQSKEEELWESYNSFYEYITDDQIDEAKDEAIEYLKSKGFTDDEIESHAETLETDLRRALADTYNSNYQNEWFKKYRKMTQENIYESITEVFDGAYKLLDDIADDDFFRERADADHLRLEISKKEIKDWLKKNYPDDAKQKDYIDLFVSSCLDYIDAKEINIEYVDYYGTMGSTDGWIDYFKDYNDIESEIENFRKDEQDKIDNLERASLELKPKIEAISKYVNQYITQEPAKTKITRQIGALKSIIKNAS